MTGDFVLTQSHFEALLRRHFASFGEPVINHSRTGIGSFHATYGLDDAELRVDCGEDSDLLEISLRRGAETRPVPLVARHQDMEWTADRLERAFADQAAEVSLYLAELGVSA